jgi:hypothetical protein
MEIRETDVCDDLPNELQVRPRAAPPDNPFFRPLPGGLAVITCYFNPCGYTSLRDNYRRFADGIHDRGVPLYTAELAFGERPFALDGEPNLSRFRARDVMWHKERLLNLLLPHVPAEFDKIAWIDADILLTDPDWPANTARLLEEFPVVQLFEEAVYLDRQGRPAEARTGVARGVADGREDAGNFGRFHPGFAWAARRDLLKQHGLLDHIISGGGDSIMVCAMFGWWRHPRILRYGPPMQRAFAAWGQPFSGEVQGRVGYVPGRVLHLCHGQPANRLYVERIDWLNHAQFSPEADLRSGWDGLWEWAGGSAWLREQMRQYFFDRRDDE